MELSGGGDEAQPHATGAKWGEDTGEGRWLTYGEIARIRGIARDSAVKLVQREKWRRQAGNDGSARILVPPDWLKPARPASPDDTPGNTGEHPPEFARVVSAFEGAVATLTEQLTRERDRADRAEARADRAEQAIAEERGRADALQERLEAEAKAAHDRAWASGEQQAAAEQRAETERARADRVQAQAAHEREDFLDAEARTRREMETVREHQDRLRAEADSAQAELAALRQAEASRRALGRLARAWRAWQGRE